MNEPLPPPLPGAAPPPPTPPPYRPPASRVAPAPGGGSLLKGLILGWVIVVGGYVLLGMVAAGLGSMGAFNTGGGEMLLVLFGIAPWLGLVALLVYYIANGEPRSAGGLGLAVVTMVAVAVLLIAACFALFASSGWR